jgi:hypothetical protein
VGAIVDKNIRRRLMIMDKVFLSSTCYDLKDLRASIEKYFENKRIVTILSDRTTFPIDPNKHRHDMCIAAINDCDLFLLVIDKRYGAPYYRDQNISITWAEYKEAKRLHKQIIVFARKDILFEREVYKKNGKSALYKPFSVDNVKTFTFIDDIQGDPNGFWVQPFDSVIEIENTLDNVITAKKKAVKPIGTISISLTTKERKLTFEYTRFTKNTKTFLALTNKREKEYDVQQLVEIRKLLSPKNNPILLDAEESIDSITIPNYIMAYPVHNVMDGDGIDFIYYQTMPTALGKLVDEELAQTIEVLDDHLPV